MGDEPLQQGQADKFHLDVKHIGVAAGHLVALMGTLDPPQKEAVSNRVQAVCDLYGPTDLLTMPNNLPAKGKTDADLARTNGVRLLGGIDPRLLRPASAGEVGVGRSRLKPDAAINPQTAP